MQRLCHLDRFMPQADGAATPLEIRCMSFLWLQAL
jgi:hypothetical protein